MKAKIEDGNIKIDLYALTDAMSEADRAAFFESVVFEEKLLQYFADIVGSDYAFDSGVWSTTYGGAGNISRLADRIREKLSPHWDEMARTTLANLKSDYEKACKTAEENRSAQWIAENSMADLKQSIRNGCVFIDGEMYVCNHKPRVALVEKP